MKVFELPNTDEILNVAREFIEAMNHHRVFAFYGELGAGKTTFIKALCELLQVGDVVSSPTFALVYEYTSPEAGVIYHFDLYRINDVNELFDLGYEDYFYSGNLCFIEWPEKAEHLLPEDAVKVYIGVNPDSSRTIKMEA